jgi:hypothetical protein
MSTPAEIIDGAVSLANNAALDASNAADNVLRLVNGRSISSSGGTGGDWSINAVEPIISDLKDGLFTYDVQLEKLTGILKNELAGFFAEYYPLASDAFDESQAWLINTITNGGTGIPSDIEDQIWQRSRDRIITEGRRVENQIKSGFAAKGEVLPAGARNAQIREVWYKQNETNGIASTNIGLKQAEIEIENIKFAVGKAIDARFSAMTAAGDYIRAIMSAPGLAVDIAGIDSNAKANMMNATSNLYSARLSRDEIVQNSNIANMKHGEWWREFIHGDFHKGIQEKVDATVSAANIYGQVASGALSSVTGIASTASSTFV